MSRLKPLLRTVEELKSAANEVIDSRRDWMIDVAETVLRNPETGFQEVKTARLVSERLSELDIKHQNGIALTGIKGYLHGAATGPTVAIIGEMDSLRVPGHLHANPETGAAHAYGHNCQLGSMLDVAAALSLPEVLGGLSGRVALIAVPAEEFIDVEFRWGLRQAGRLSLMSGKQEFIRLGAFDDIGMSMMVHTSASRDDARFSLGGSDNGHLVKYVKFIGQSSHAGSTPHQGINAL